MATRRKEIMTFTGPLAGLAIAGASLIATVSKHPLSSPLFIVSVLVAAVCSAVFVLAGFAALPALVRPMLQARRKPVPLNVRRWRYTTDGLQVATVARAMEIGLPGASTKLPGERPPWVRFVATIACSQMSQPEDPDRPWLVFRALLEEPLVETLIGALTTVGFGYAWQRWAPSRPGVVDGVLARMGRDSLAAASARLELPVGGARYGRDERYAMMILHVEPRDESGAIAPPQSLDFWAERLNQVLWLPEALSKELTDLGWVTSGEPPAQLGVRLDAPGDLADMVDITGMFPMRGGQRASQATGYFIADPNGRGAADVAQEMTRDMLLYALKAERYAL